MNTRIGLSGLLAAAAFAALSSFTTPAVAQQSTLDTIKARGTLIVGNRNDFPPAGYVDKSGEWIGFDLDMSQYIADKLGVKLQRVLVTSPTRIPLLQSGNVDVVIATLGPSSERAQAIDFTLPYFAGGLRVLTRKGSGITSVMDLAEPRKTGMTQGSSDGVVVQTFQPKASITYFQEWPLAVQALRAGKVDAVVTTDFTLEQLSRGDSSLEIVGPVFLPDVWIMGVRQNDSKWRLFLDQTIGQAWQDGTIAKLYAKYFGGGKPEFTPPVWREYLIPKK